MSYFALLDSDSENETKVAAPKIAVKKETKTDSKDAKASTAPAKAAAAPAKTAAPAKATDAKAGKEQPTKDAAKKDATKKPKGNNKYYLFIIITNPSLLIVIDSK